MDSPAMDSSPRTVSALLGAALAHIGVRRLFGAPSGGMVGIEGLPHVRVEEPILAAVMAAAAGRVGPGPGAALLPDRTLMISTVPGYRSKPVVVTDPGQLVEVVAAWDRVGPAAAIEIVLDLDLDQPAPADAAVLSVDHGAAGMTLAADLRGPGVMVVAGPGVQRAGRVEDLRALVRSGGIAVAVTVAGTAMLAADDPWFAGVVGLQERDAALAGLADAHLVVLTGVDEVELPGDTSLWGRAQVLEVPPAHLVTLGLRWQPPDPPAPEPSELVGVVSELVQAQAGSARSAVAACQALGAVARADAVVAVDAGPAGLWMARVPTSATPGSVHVPGLRAPGFAMAAAMSAAFDGRAAFAVVNDPVDPVTAALVELAEAWRLDLVVASWGADAGAPDEVAGADGGESAGSLPSGSSQGGSAQGGSSPVDHAARWTAGLRAARREGGVTQVGLDVDPTATRQLVQQVGPVAGWQHAP
jgi:hypothetical protein